MVYKIKDNVDLNLLEKFGYEYIPVVDGYYKVYYPKFLGIITMLYSSKLRGISIYSNNRIINTKRPRSPLDLDWIPTTSESFPIKDLIKAGMVEEVPESDVE